MRHFVETFVDSFYMVIRTTLVVPETAFEVVFDQIIHWSTQRIHLEHFADNEIAFDEAFCMVILRSFPCIFFSYRTNVTVNEDAF